MTWSRYTNEKIYLASLQIRLMENAENEAISESLRQGCLLLLNSAYHGLLQEIAESRHLRGAINDLENLKELIGHSTQEIDLLEQWSTESDSWLWHLENELKELNVKYKTIETTKQNKEGENVSESVGAGKSSLLVSDSNEMMKLDLLLNAMKGSISNLREQLLEW